MLVDLRTHWPHVLIWLTLLLFPALAFVPGGVATVQKLLHIVLALEIIILWFVFRPRSSGAALLRITIAYTAVTVIYYAVCTLLWSAEITSEDMADLVRPFVYLLYFGIPVVFELGAVALRRLIAWLRVVVIISIFFSALVYWPTAWPLIDLYKGRPSDDEVVMHFFRWSGTFGYPSDFAFVLSFFIYFSTIDWLRHRKISLASAAFLALTTIGLVMTLSRGGILTVAFMLALILAVLGIRWSPRHVIAGGTAALVLAATIIASWSSIEGASTDQGNFAYVGAMFAGSKIDRSTAHRIREGERALKEAYERFPVGSGPNKERWKEELRVVESLYGHLLLKWGAIGLMLYLAGVGFIVHACRQVYRLFAADDFIPVFAAATATTVISVPLIFGFSSAMSDRFKVLGFYYLMAGYACSLFAQARAAQVAGTPFSRAESMAGRQDRVLSANGAARRVERLG